MNRFGQHTELLDDPDFISWHDSECPEKPVLQALIIYQKRLLTGWLK